MQSKISAVIFLALFSFNAQASLIGDEVTFTATTDNSFVNPFGPANASVGAGPEFNWTAYTSNFNTGKVVVDFGAESLDLIFSISFGDKIFDGETILTFTGLDWGVPGELTGVTVLQNFDFGSYADNDYAINLLGSDAFEIVFNPFAFGDSETSPSFDTLKLGLETIHKEPPVPVPAPAAIWLFGVGLLGLGFARRRKA